MGVLNERQKQVIMALANYGMNHTHAAQSLYLVSSTVEYHIEQIREKTGKNADDFWDLQELVKMVKGERK